MEALLFEALTYFMLRHFLGRLGDVEIWSKADLDAKSAYLAAREAFDGARIAVGAAFSLRRMTSEAGMEIGALPLAAFCRIVPGGIAALADPCREAWEIFEEEFERAASLVRGLAIAEDDAALKAWADDVVRSSEGFIANGGYARLGVAVAILHEDQDEGDEG